MPSLYQGVNNFTKDWPLSYDKIAGRLFRSTSTEVRKNVSSLDIHLYLTYPYRVLKRFAIVYTAGFMFSSS
jgi:hypothetical protein